MHSIHLHVHHPAQILFYDPQQCAAILESLPLFTPPNGLEPTLLYLDPSHLALYSPQEIISAKKDKAGKKKRKSKVCSRQVSHPEGGPIAVPDIFRQDETFPLPLPLPRRTRRSYRTRRRVRFPSLPLAIASARTR